MFEHIPGLWYIRQKTTKKREMTVADDVKRIGSGDCGSIERQSGFQFIRVEGTLFQVSVRYLLKISDVFATFEEHPIVWKINGVTDPVVFMATLWSLHSVQDNTRVSIDIGWSPGPVLDYIGTSWTVIIENIKRLQTKRDYQMAATYLHTLDRVQRTCTSWDPLTITHWLTTYAPTEKEDVGDWIYIHDVVSGFCGSRKLSVHEEILYRFLFVQTTSSYSRALVGVLRRWSVIQSEEQNRRIVYRILSDTS